MDFVHHAGAGLCFFLSDVGVKAPVPLTNVFIYFSLCTRKKKFEGHILCFPLSYRKQNKIR